MMNDVIALLDEIETDELDDYGDKIIKQEIKEVFAERMSVGMQEFYQAQTEGFKPEIKFLLSDYLDYDNQKYVIYNGFKYKVLRTYQKGNQLEITVYGGVRNERSEVGN